MQITVRIGCAEGLLRKLKFDFQESRFEHEIFITDCILVLDSFLLNN